MVIIYAEKAHFLCKKPYLGYTYTGDYLVDLSYQDIPIMNINQCEQNLQNQIEKNPNQ